MIEFCDAHIHFSQEFLRNFNTLLIPWMQKNQTTTCVHCGTHFGDWFVPLLNDEMQLHSCVGFHPWFLPHNNEKQTSLLKLKEFLDENKQCAVGEIGLDFLHNKMNIEEQEFWFEEQLKIAVYFKRPVVIHSLKSWNRMIPILKKYQLAGGMIHAFHSSLEIANILITMGFKLSFGKAILNTHSQNRFKILLNELNQNQILFESDAEQFDLSYKLPSIYSVAASLMNQKQEDLIRSTRSNVFELFAD